MDMEEKTLTNGNERCIIPPNNVKLEDKRTNRQQGRQK